MDILPEVPSVSVDLSALARLMPMYALISRDGRLRALGPTLAKVCGSRAVPGTPFLDLFRFLRPACAKDIAHLVDFQDDRLIFALRDRPDTTFRGQVVSLGAGQGLLLNLSFGISAADAVAEYGLSSADFAVTDLTVELLYLTEANVAVMGEIAALNNRMLQARNRAERRALTDSLTGLSNRRALELSLRRLTQVDPAANERRQARDMSNGKGFAVLQLDLDHFKAVNDTFGHAAGDHVLRHVGMTLRAETRQSDVVARLGGDEFVLILPGFTDPVAVMKLARRIISRLESPIEYQGQECRISGSIGIALSTDYAIADVDRLLSDADAALYLSKHEGRGRAMLHRLIREDMTALDPAEAQIEGN